MGVALVFVAATLMATNVAANDGEIQQDVPQSEITDVEAQADGLFGLKIYNINASEFTVADDADTYNLDLNSGRCLQFSQFAYAPVEIPHGSTISSVNFSAFDNTATGDITVTLRKNDFAANTQTNLFSGGTGFSETPGYASFSASSDGGDNELNKSSQDLFVFAGSDAETSSLELCNVQIFYFPPLSGGLEFHAIDPCAIFDTRSGSGSFNGKLDANEVITVDAVLADYSSQGGFAGSCDVASAGGLFTDGELLTRSIAINLVSLDAEGSGNLKAWANNVSEPPGGVVVYEPGVNNSNEFALDVEGGVSCGILCVTNGGLFKVKNNSSSSVHVRGVVVGYFTQVDSNQ